jgi:hypothetical protein
MTILPTFYQPAVNSGANKTTPMITWTHSARTALDHHNQTVRPQLLAGGADPDEVAADLHRHIEEELTAAKIPVATRDDIQRILSRMGVAVPAIPAPADRPSTILPRALLIGVAIGAAMVISFLYFRIARNQPGAPIITKPAETAFPCVIDFTPSIPEWGRFSSGDKIVITSIRGNRPHIELGGSYLIEGTYTLASMENAELLISATATSRDSPGAISPVHPEEVTRVSRGMGRFSLMATMRYVGRFHVSFNPMGGGKSHGTIYFEETPPGSAKTSEPKNT